jgi:hypothetical protein
VSDVGTTPDVSVVVRLRRGDRAPARRADSTRPATFEIVLVVAAPRPHAGDPARLRRAAVRVLTMTRNFGQSAALCCGIFESRRRIVVTMDGDLQNPPEEVPTLLRALGPGVDLVTARREVRHERVWRLVGSRVVHRVARVLIGADLQDIGEQFKAYRRGCGGDPDMGAEAVLRAPVGFRVARSTSPDPQASRYAETGAANVDLITSFGVPLVVLALCGLACRLRGISGVAGAPRCVLPAIGPRRRSSRRLPRRHLARVYRTVAGAPAGFAPPPAGRPTAVAVASGGAGPRPRRDHRAPSRVPSLARWRTGVA